MVQAERDVASTFAPTPAPAGTNIEQGIQDRVQAGFEDVQEGDPTAFFGGLCWYSITH